MKVILFILIMCRADRVREMKKLAEEISKANQSWASDSARNLRLRVHHLAAQSAIFGAGTRTTCRKGRIRAAPQSS